MRRMPLVARVMEGATTNMLLGYWYAGGAMMSPLSLAYLLHWMASINEHIYPSHRNFVIDTHFIDMVTMERMFAITGSYYIHLFYLLTMWTNTHHPFVCFCKVLSMVSILYLCGKTSTTHLLVVLHGGALYAISDYFFQQSMLYWKVVFHIAFHMSMTMASFIEKDFYHYDQASLDWFRIVVWMVYLFQGLVYAI